jgi:hypothetical protein
MNDSASSRRGAVEIIAKQSEVFGSRELEAPTHFRILLYLNSQDALARTRVRGYEKRLYLSGRAARRGAQLCSAPSVSCENPCKSE